MLAIDMEKSKMAVFGTQSEIMAELSFLINQLMTNEKGPQLDKEDIETVVKCAMMTEEERRAELERAEAEINAFKKYQEELAREAFLRDLMEGMIGKRR